MLDICRCALVPYVQRAQGAPALYLARPQDASDVLPVLHRAGTLRCRPDQPDGVDAHEVVLPRHLQFLLRPAATLLCRHRQAVEPLEISQLGCRHHRHRHHALARAQRMAALRYHEYQGRALMAYAIIIESLVMLVYCSIAMRQVWYWIRESRDANYSNPDDFSVRFASIVLFYPIILTPFVWPAYILDSRQVMAALHILLAVFNNVLLITVMPA